MTTHRPDDRWYYAKDKKKAGPVSLDQLRRLLVDGGLKPADMVLQEGTLKWRPLAEVAGSVRPRLRLPWSSWTRRKQAVVGGVGASLVILAAWGVTLLWNRSGPPVGPLPPSPVAQTGQKPTPAEEKGKEKPATATDPGKAEMQKPVQEREPERQPVAFHPERPPRLVA
jgi:hypothetical protein